MVFGGVNSHLETSSLLLGCFLQSDRKREAISNNTVHLCLLDDCVTMHQSGGEKVPTECFENTGYCRVTSLVHDGDHFTFLGVTLIVVGEQEDVLRAAVALQLAPLQQPVHPLDDALQAFIYI